MKILVISDTHLSLPFEEKKYEFLKKIISRADSVILCGDFWEGYEITFDEFLASPWKGLFPLLKARNAIYLFGNHDQKKFSDQRADIFSVKQIQSYVIQENGKSYFFEHGNRLCTFFDETLPFRLPRIWGTVTEAIVKYGTRTYQKKFIKIVHERFNRVIKKKMHHIPENGILFTGHTHFAEKDLKNRYVNTGFIKYGLAQFVILEGGRIESLEEWYDPPV